MSKRNEKTTFVYIAAYAAPSRARMDHKVLQRLRDEGRIERFDVALVSKDDEGQVHVRKRERRTGKGAVAGAGMGALLGLLIPFVAIPVTASINAGRGGAMSYFLKGMSRKDIGELGEALGSGQAALVVLSEHDLEDTLDRELRGADRRIQRRIQGQADELTAALTTG